MKIKDQEAAIAHLMDIEWVEAGRVSTKDAIEYWDSHWASTSGKIKRIDGTIMGCPADPPRIDDLNYLRIVEKRLGDGSRLWDRYCDYLGGSLYHCAHASAEQKREAILRTFNLWKDEPNE